MKRCSYESRRGRCQNPGIGSPAFCDAHAPDDEWDDDEPSPIIMAVADRLADHPATGRVIDSFGALIDKIGTIFDGSAFQPAPQPVTAGAANGTARNSPPRAKRNATPPPPPPRSVPRAESPRVLLGFAEGAKLTKEVVKKRHRDFAKICHSDHGGNDETMRRLNAARDALLKECR